MERKIISNLLGDLGKAKGESKKSGLNKAVTLKVSDEAHERYERLQQLTGREISKKVRALFLMVLDEAEAKLKVS
jgi:hypothetical protein